MTAWVEESAAVELAGWVAFTLGLVTGLLVAALLVPPVDGASCAGEEVTSAACSS